MALSDSKTLGDGVKMGTTPSACVICTPCSHSTYTECDLHYLLLPCAHTECDLLSLLLPRDLSHSECLCHLHASPLPHVHRV